MRPIVGEVHTEIGRLRVARAGARDLKVILAIMREAAAWLQGRGINQWVWLLGDHGRTVVQSRLHYETFLLMKGFDAVGTLYIRWDCPEIWEETGLDDQAGYVHGFAIKRKVGGHGVGRAFLAWAARYIATHGKRYIRLDTADDNPAICAYYERLGFRPCGVKAFSGYANRRYEKEAGE